jgi:hypothetical protein
MLKARTRRAAALARIAELDLALQRGEVVQVDDVAQVWATKIRSTRDSILLLPDRLGARIAAETDPIQVHALLMSELLAALAGLEIPEPEAQA